MATIKEIAQLASVSPTTVSRVLTQDPTLSVAPATRERIGQLARELGYTARRTRSAASPQRMVGLIHGDADLLSPAITHFGALTRVVENTLSAKNYGRLTFSLDSLPDSPLDAIIALGQYSPAQLSTLSKLSPTLLFLYTSPDPLRFDSICLDTQTLADSAVAYLHQLGHRRIAYIGASDVIGGMRMKDLFFTDMRHALLLADPQGDQWMYIGDYTPTSAYALTCDLLRGTAPALRPTAIIYATDSLALGGYKAVRECGLCVGRDVSILSVDDAPTSSYLTPPLTAFHVDVDFIAETAVQMLDDRLSGRRTHTFTARIPLGLSRRQSCQSAPAR